MRSLRCVVLCATVIVLARVPAARAQAGSQPGGPTPASAGAPTSDDAESRRSTTRKWALELHAGLGAPVGAPGGSGSLPSTGTVTSGLLSASTFAFGTGASLLNANLTSAGAASAVITPLDSLLLGNAVTREPQALAGLRIQRALTRRLSLSIAGDYMRSTLSFEPSALTALETTRTSYITGLTRALSSPTLASSVTAVTTVTDHQASQMVRGTGSLVYDLTVGRRLTPFVTVGGGVVTASEKMPTATLVGSSSLGNGTSIYWTDTVTLTYSHSTDYAFGLGAAGFTYDLSKRLGVRVQAELQLSPNSQSNLVAAVATRSLESTGAAFPSLTFGNVPFNQTGPLNAVPVSETETRSGSGLERRGVVTTGFYLRF